MSELASRTAPGAQRDRPARAPLSTTQAVLLVARREFVTQIRSRSFVIGLVFTLALFAIGGVVGTFIASQGSSSSLGLTSEAAPLRAALEDTARTQDIELRITDVDDPAGRAQVGDGDLDALLSGGPGGYALLGDDSIDDRVLAIVSTAVRQQALTVALTGAGVDPAQLATQSQVATTTLEPVDPNAGQQLALALVATVLLFFSLNYAAVVAAGVVEEKQSRVVELLLATIKPVQLLAGKVLGLGLVGLLNLLILGAVGVLVGAATGVLTLPGAAVGTLAMAIGWYLLGFFLFAAVYAAIASTVSRQEELQNALAPMGFVLFIPLILTVYLLPTDPESELMTVLSFVPFFSQTVMPARFALGVAPLWQVGVAALLAIVAIVVVVQLGARIYRNSILRTGARVSLREALRG